MDTEDHSPVEVSFEEIVVGTYKDLSYNKLILRECGTLATYWEDIELCSSKEALEVGYGDGVITMYLLERGYRVTAIDHDQRVAKALLQNLERGGAEVSNCTVRVERIEEYVPEENKYAVIVVSYVLRFLEEPLVWEVFDRLKRSLAPKGVLLVRVHHSDLAASICSVGDTRYKHLFQEEEIDSRFTQGFDILFASKFSRRTPRFEEEAYARSMMQYGLEYADSERGKKCISLEYLIQKV